MIDQAAWEKTLGAVIGRLTSKRLNRVVVAPEVGSTQDEARRLALGAPGVVVVADRQLAGRGRLGRVWSDGAGRGVALTAAIETGAWDDATLSLAAGVAAARAIEAAAGIDPDALTANAADHNGLAAGRVNPLAWAVKGQARLIARPRIGLRWPNDVVEAPFNTRRHRKLAGVLVERADSLALIGIGVNVEQRETDWPPELRERATSLFALGSAWSRVQVAGRLIEELARVLEEAPATIVEAWRRRDILAGTRQTFERDGQRVTGLVEAIEPTSEIRVRADDGSVVRLPAPTTSLTPS